MSQNLPGCIFAVGFLFFAGRAKNIDFFLYIFEKKDRSEKGEKGERSETKRV